MDIFCYVADAKIAESLIVRELRACGLIEGAVIAHRAGDTVEVLWPPNFDGTFSII